MQHIVHYDSPLGNMTLAAEGDALVGVWFDGQKYFGSTLEPGVKEKSNNDPDAISNASAPVLNQTLLWLEMYFAFFIPTFTPHIKLIGTPFQKAVWNILLNVRYGELVSYGTVADVYAEHTGHETSSRAVANAVARNPIALIVPCHRVIRSNGYLSGYAAGANIKNALVNAEHKNVTEIKVHALHTGIKPHVIDF